MSSYYRMHSLTTECVLLPHVIRRMHAGDGLHVSDAHMPCLLTNALRVYIQDLQRVKGVMALVDELQAEAQKMPPDIQMLQNKAGALDTEVQAVQASVVRLQETADLVAASREDILEVMQLSEKVQERTAKLEPLVAPLSDVFSCVAGGFENFNWTALKEVAVGRDEPVSEWAEVFLKADRDGGGTLNISEFEAIQWQKYNSSKVDFGHLDTDETQELDASEWRQYHINGVAVAVAQVDEEAALAQGESVESLEASRALCRAFLQRHRSLLALY